MPIYRALTPAPLTEKTNETFINDRGEAKRSHRVTHWPIQGEFRAEDHISAYQIARATFGGRPVVEQIEEPIHYVKE
jgi:hypothetical protein